VKIRVALVYNQPSTDRYGAMGESAAELGVLDEVAAVSCALAELNYAYLPVPLLPPLSRVRETLRAIKADVVFNLFEGFEGSPETEAEVASIYSEFKLPFTGCPPAALRLALDKSQSKTILRAAGVATPEYQVLTADSLDSFKLKLPCIVKPPADDSSHGISEASVVYDIAALRQQTLAICRLFGGRALVEEFVDGREFNTVVIGNKRLSIPAVSEIVYTLPPGKPRLLTFESKWAEDSVYYKNTRAVCPADITEPAKAKIAKAARRAFRALGCRGYARVDFRQNRRGEYLALEVNPNPDITPEPGVSLQIAAAGLSNAAFVEKLIRLAIKYLSVRL
jgi:D-alanine-D-alanine ligase